MMLNFNLSDKHDRNLQHEQNTSRTSIECIRDKVLSHLVMLWMGSTPPVSPLFLTPRALTNGAISSIPVRFAVKKRPRDTDAKEVIQTENGSSNHTLQAVTTDQKALEVEGKTALVRQVKRRRIAKKIDPENGPSEIKRSKKPR